MTCPAVTVEIAFNASYDTPAASRVYTDVTAYVMVASGIPITHGRQDELSQAEANTIALTFNNSDGRFTPGRAASPYYPNVKIGRPIRVTATPEGEAASVRFVGYIDEWPIEWPAVVSTYATSTITASSRKARIGLSRPLPTLPTLELPALEEAAGGFIGNFAHRPLAINRTGYTLRGTGEDPTFSAPDNVALTDNLPMLNFTAGKFLTSGVAADPRALVFITTTAGYLIAGRTDFEPAADFADQIKVTDDGVLEYTRRIAGSGVTTTTTGTTVVTDGLPHSLVLLSEGDTGTYPLYLDGVVELADVPFGGGTERVVGGGINENGDALSPSFTGHIGRLVEFDGDLLDVAEMDAWARMYDDIFRTGFADEAAADRLARYASYGAVPVAEQDIDANALTPMAHIDTEGTTPADLISKVVETDGGVAYDARDNTLTYAARDVRYNPTPDITLSVASGQVQTPYAPKLDRSALLNKVDATVAGSESGVEAENDASITEYGIHGATIELSTTDEDEAHAAAFWRVNTYGEPSARVPELVVELTQFPAAVQSTLLGLKIGDVIGVDGLPSQSDTSSKEFFVEGYTETIAEATHTLAFNVSPTTGFDVWTIEDPVLGQYDAYPIAY